MLPRPLDWSLMVPANPPTPCKSTKSKLPDAEIRKGHRSTFTILLVFLNHLEGERNVYNFLYVQFWSDVVPAI